MSSPRGARARIAPGIYKDAIGYAAVVVVGSGDHRQQREHRFPPGTSLRAMTAWQTATRVLFRKRAKRAALRAPSRGSLQADVDAYLPTVAHLASVETVTILLAHWTARYGTLPRHKLTPAHVETTRQAWRDAGASPKTINNRVQALARLYHALDGAKAPTPCDEVRPFTVAPVPPVAVAPETIRAVHDRLLAHEQAGRLSPVVRARFMVYAASGRRPSEIMRAQPGDVDLTRRIWRVRDGKGGWTPGGLYLHDDLLAAWETFIAADAWGRFLPRDFADTLRRRGGWPAGLRVYHLRHSVGLALAEGGADLADISAWLGHTRPLTTRSHYVPVSSGRMRTSSDRLDQRIGWHPRLAPTEKPKE